MHGYFLSLKLYDAARVIANPFAYTEHREKMVREKMEKMAEGRIRAKKDVGVKVNKALAEKIHRAEEKERNREERKKSRKAQKNSELVDEMDVDENVEKDAIDGGENDGKLSLLTDPRFTQLFENPEFAIDETSREYALMNPSAVARKANGSWTKTAVEDEEEESDKASSDGLGSSDSGSEASASDDSSDAGGKLSFSSRISDIPTNYFSSDLNAFDPRARPGQKNERVQEAYARKREQNRTSNVTFVPLRAQSDSTGNRRQSDKSATFGQRRSSDIKGQRNNSAPQRAEGASRSADAGIEMSWVPSESSRIEDDDKLVPGGSSSKKRQDRRKSGESFGAGMEKGTSERHGDMSNGDRKGRTERRKGVRSGSKNSFRRM
jgi:ribosome biogenesis protein ENP2